MNRREIVDAVRDNLRDFSGTIIRSSTIYRYINEGIDRIGQVLPELAEMEYLTGDEQVPDELPRRYHQLLVFYASGRCFDQDENSYQAVQYMNECEVKLEELRYAVDCGDVVLGETGQIVNRRNEYVRQGKGLDSECVQNSPEIYEV